MSRLARYLPFLAFGIRLGLANLLHHGFRLGLRKTLGKILQPVNAWTRYPEYDFFHRMLAPPSPPSSRARLLDLGSPKLFGLFLASRYPYDLVLSDLDPAALHEVQVLWEGRQETSPGRIAFSRLDARRLPYPDGHFEAVYSMSVVEHVDEPGGDHRALAEMLRVTRPGGRVVLSFPVGARFQSQHRIGFSYTRRVEPHEPAFFQRIYDQAGVEALLDHPGRIAGRETLLVRRCGPRLVGFWRRLGLPARALLGWLNPWVAAASTEELSAPDSLGGDLDVYGDEHRLSDVYSDLLVALVRR